MLELVNAVSPGTTLKYNKHYVGLSRAGVVDNYVVLRPRREHLIAEFRIPRSDEVTALIEDSGIDSLEYFKRYGQYRMRLTSKDLNVHRELLLDLVRRASRTPPVEEDSG